MQDSPRPGREAQRFRGTAEAAQTVHGARVGTRGVRYLLEAAIQLARLAVVFERCLVLAEQTIGVATYLSGGGLVLLVTLGIRERDRFVGNAQGLPGATNQVRTGTLQQPIEADLLTTLREPVGQSEHVLTARRRSIRSRARQSGARRR